MDIDELHKLQLKFQADAVVQLEEKLQEQQKKTYQKQSKSQNTFQKFYLNPIVKAIQNIREKDLSTVVAKILKSQDYFLQEIKNNLKDFQEWKDYTRLEKAVKVDDIKPYLIDDISIYLSLELLKLIDTKEIFFKKDSIFYKLFELLIKYIVDMDNTIKEYELQQKQAFTLFTLALNSTDIVYSSFIALSKISVIVKKDEEDKVNPTSEQAIIKDIGELLFDKIASTLNNNFMIVIDEPSNNYLIEMASEIFIFFEYYNIVEKEEDNQDKLDTYKFSKEFAKKGDIILKTILKYATPFYEPMIVPPLPWFTIDDGGYLRGENISSKYKLLIQKTKSKKDRQFLQEQKDTISQDFLSAINILQATPWRINKTLLKVVEKKISSELKESIKLLKEKEQEKKFEVKQLKKNIADLVLEKKSIYKSYDRDIKKAEERYAHDKNRLKEEKELLKEERKKETKEFTQKIYQLIEQKKSIFSELKNRVQKLKVQQKIIDIAKKYKDFKNIYFTWQVDFRGRIYPVQTLLNPQGEDLSKALLTFSETKPLGKKGLFWLQVHGANCYGVDKVSFAKRVEWVEEHTQEIQKVVTSDNPLDEPFLQASDDEFKFLAFCYEYNRYLEDRENFTSSLPIAIDGSNNGFQHISALLRDKDGAKKVNVLPNDEDKPADIYNEVAQTLIKILPNEDTEGKVATKDIELIKTKIDRSFVKKGVMTDSYGAGRETKAMQIQDFIEDNIEDLKLKNIEQLSLFISKYLDNAIDIVAPSSAKYKKWINDLGKRISKQKKPIIWDTPFLNFKVKQVKYITKTDRITTHFEGKKNSIQIQIETDKIDKNQYKGIAPNFIHSLDATHLYMTILASSKNGIKSFATVHDSFATHACDVERLSQILKEQFVKLTQYNVLERLQETMKRDYDLEIVKEMPKKDKENKIVDINTIFIDNDFNIEEIHKSNYFFA